MVKERKQRYHHQKIESNWKAKWYADNIYAAKDFSPKPKKYILAELPYPSGKSIHVGHAMRYTAPEMYSRFLRMQGYNVLFPMGWDAFGLPTEMFALKNKITPQEATQRLVVDYKQAVMDMGYAVDWNREINTTDPAYYKWTQWLFLKFFEHGLAKYREMPVWYSESCGILADEEVINNDQGEKVAERDGSKVERKLFKQWVLQITAYAEKLLDGLTKVDFPEAIKNAQINWIGKSTGAEVEFELFDETNHKIDQIKVFTTRPDTLFGITFLAIAPEQPSIQKLADSSTNKSAVEEYTQAAKNRSEMERKTAKAKSGIQLKGLYAKHPFAEVTRKLPVFVADYILMDYGTGSIMGVPAHDDRDYDFAKEHGLDIIHVIQPPKDAALDQLYTGHGTMINSDQYNGLHSEDFFAKAIARLEKEQKGKKAVTYKIRDWVFSRQRYWGEPIPIIHKQDGTMEAEKKLPLELPFSTDYTAEKDGTPPLGKLSAWINTTDSQGNPAKREAQTMPTWAGSSWYFIRYVDPKNDQDFADYEKMRYWLPVDKYFGGAEHTTVHLLYSRFWFEFLHDIGLVPYPEPYQWRMNGGLMLGPDGKKMSKRLGNVMEPGTLIENYGADATRLAVVFIGPYSGTYPWNKNIIKAMWRLVNTIYDLKDKVRPHQDPKITKAYYTMVRNVTAKCDELKMNTAVSEIMVFVNALKKAAAIDPDIWKGFVKTIAPFMPFLAEELWQEINEFGSWQAQNSVHLQTWPTYQESEDRETGILIPVMIDGKVRGHIMSKHTDTNETIRAKVLAETKLAKYLAGKELTKLVYVKDKIVSLQLN